MRVVEMVLTDIFSLNLKSARKFVATAAALPIAGAMVLGSVLETTSAQQGVVFGGTVGLRHFCQIILMNPGTITPSPDLMELSSKQTGGTAGRAEITTTNGSFSVISVDAPPTFQVAPTNGDTGVTFAASYLASGATLVTETSGTVQTQLGNGVTLLDVHLVASRVGTPFPQGAYNAVTTVLCEAGNNGNSNGNNGNNGNGNN